MHRRTLFQLATIATLSTITGLVSMIAPAARTLVVFGDSIASGSGLPHPEACFANQVAVQLGLALDNRAVPGSRILDQLPLMHDIPPNATILWLTGFNDMRYGPPLDAYQTHLKEGLALLPGAYVGNCLHMADYTIDGIAYGSDAAVAAFNAVIANEVPPGRLVDVDAVFDPHNVDDGTHPNAIGHQQIAAAFLTTRRQRVALPQITKD